MKLDAFKRAVDARAIRAMDVAAAMIATPIVMERPDTAKLVIVGLAVLCTELKASRPTDYLRIVAKTDADGEVVAADIVSPDHAVSRKLAEGLEVDKILGMSVAEFAAEVPRDKREAVEADLRAFVSFTAAAAGLGKDDGWTHEAQGSDLILRFEA